jgi:hypothetical protein
MTVVMAVSKGAFDNAHGTRVRRRSFVVAPELYWQKTHPLSGEFLVAHPISAMPSRSYPIASPRVLPNRARASGNEASSAPAGLVR